MGRLGSSLGTTLRNAKNANTRDQRTFPDHTLISRTHIEKPLVT